MPGSWREVGSGFGLGSCGQGKPMWRGFAGKGGGNEERTVGGSADRVEGGRGVLLKQEGAGRKVPLVVHEDAEMKRVGRDDWECAGSGREVVPARHIVDNRLLEARRLCGKAKEFLWKNFPGPLVWGLAQSLARFRQAGRATEGLPVVSRQASAPERVRMPLPRWERSRATAP